MSRKDYQRIAKAVSTTVEQMDRHKGRERQVALHTCWELAQQLSIQLAADSPTFNRETFLRACEVI